VIRVVREVVAGIGMRKDFEIAPIKHEPLCNLAELLDGNRELATAARMGSDGPNMIMTFRNAKALSCGMT
jgi:hypothetical protein